MKYPKHPLASNILRTTIIIGTGALKAVIYFVINEYSQAARYNECKKKPNSIIAESNPPICIISGEESQKASPLFN